MLEMCYEYQVTRRGNVYRKSEELQRILRLVAHWLRGESKTWGLMLCGYPGNGKTTLADAIKMIIDHFGENDDCSKSRALCKIDAVTLSDFAQDNKKKEDFNRYKQREMLYIDDLGTEPDHVNSFGNEGFPLVEVIKYRNEHQLLTVVTTNLKDEADLVKQYGARIADRIREMFDVITFEAPSYRGT